MVVKKIGISDIDFDFEKFVNFLSNGDSVVEGGKLYYTGTVREKVGDKHSKESMSEQTKFFSEMKKGNWSLRTTKLKTRIESISVDSRMQDFEKIRNAGVSKIVYERKREKGIDVMLATDLIAGAVEDKYDRAIVISSDADLIPAIKWIREKRKKHIEYIGFSISNIKVQEQSTKPLLSMMRETDSQRVLSEVDIKGFIKPNILSDIQSD